MNILMVGHSRSGKTSFMAGMYKYLGESKEGYGIRAKSSTQKKNLERMAAGLSQNRYPAGTDVQQKYDFALTFFVIILYNYNHGEKYEKRKGWIYE